MKKTGQKKMKQGSNSRICDVQYKYSKNRTLTSVGLPIILRNHLKYSLFAYLIYHYPLLLQLNTNLSSLYLPQPRDVFIWLSFDQINLFIHDFDLHEMFAIGKKNEKGIVDRYYTSVMQSFGLDCFDRMQSGDGRLIDIKKL